MGKKFELTAECKVFCGVKLFRIKALRAIAQFGVKVGDLGGWVEKEENLCHFGDAWVHEDARVFGDARVHEDAWVCGNARVYEDAQVCGNARVCGNAWVCGNARVCDNADCLWFKNTWSSGRWFTYTRSNKKWKVGCFYGTGEELIAKAYKAAASHNFKIPGLFMSVCVISVRFQMHLSAGAC